MPVGYRVMVLGKNLLDFCFFLENFVNSSTFVRIFQPNFFIQNFESYNKRKSLVFSVLKSFEFYNCANF